MQNKLKKKQNKKQKKIKQKTKQTTTKKRGNKLSSYFTIVLSSYDADLSFDQNTDQRLFFLQVTVADNTNSRNNNTIGEITPDKMIISSLSECIIFFTVLTTECVAIVTVNLLSIIIFIKNKSLRTRSLYLVMSLTVADVLVGQSDPLRLKV